MKKLVSVVAAIAMTSSAFASICSAAWDYDTPFAAVSSCDKTAYEVGDTIKVTYEVLCEDNIGFNAVGGLVTFDTSKFEYVTASIPDDASWPAVPVLPRAVDSNVKGTAGVTFANDANTYWGDGERYYAEMEFKVKDGVAPGNYTFGLKETKSGPIVFDEMDNEYDITYDSQVAFEVVGAPEPTPEVVQAANGTKDYGDGFKTVGLNGYVIPNSGLNTIAFTFSTGDSYNFDLKNTFTGDSQVTYGLNIIDVPSNETIEVDTAVGVLLDK